MSIRLHKEHGVNPAIYQCYWCGEDIGLVLPGADVSKFKDAGLTDASGKMNMNVGAIDYTPCDKCKEYMKQGVILISVRDGDEAYRTGGFVVVKDEVIKRMVQPDELVDQVLEKRICFISDTVWKILGLKEVMKDE